MKWSYLLAILLVLIVIANVIALNALPDMIAGFNVVMIALVLAGIGYVIWQRRRNN